MPLELEPATLANRVAVGPQQPASIEALSAVFSADPGANPLGDRFCTHLNGATNLLQVGHRLAGTGKLVGLYVTENPEWDYNPDPQQFGRVVALVRMLPMAPSKTIYDYESGCKEFKRDQFVDRWPVGWPCQFVFFSPHGGPYLRDIVLHNKVVRSALGIKEYHDFAAQFLHGPIALWQFSMGPLRQKLMEAVRHEMAQNPQTQLLPF